MWGKGQLATNMMPWGKGQLRLPRAASIVRNDDDAALPARAPANFEYAEEAKRAAQRYLDQLGHIEQLTTERDDWRSRALAAENEVTRLLRREAALLAQIDSKSDVALKQAEDYKTTLTVIGAQYASAAKLLLDGFAAPDKAALRVESDMPSLVAAARQRQAAEPLNKPEDTPLPRVVMQGPLE